MKIEYQNRKFDMKGKELSERRSRLK